MKFEIAVHIDRLGAVHCKMRWVESGSEGFSLKDGEEEYALITNGTCVGGSLGYFFLEKCEAFGYLIYGLDRSGIAAREFVIEFLRMDLIRGYTGEIQFNLEERMISIFQRASSSRLRGVTKQMHGLLQIAGEVTEGRKTYFPLGEALLEMAEVGKRIGASLTTYYRGEGVPKAYFQELQK